MSEEEWKAVLRWEGLYEVSDVGRVRSLDRAMVDTLGRSHVYRGRVLRPTPNHDGYLRVNLVDGLRHKSVRISVPVCEAWHEPRPGGQHVRHYPDGDKTNDHPSNLSWDTRSRDTHDQVEHGTHVDSRKRYCPADHEYTEANTYRGPDGHRRCRMCRAAMTRARRVKGRAA